MSSALKPILERLAIRYGHCHRYMAIRNGNSCSRGTSSGSGSSSSTRIWKLYPAIPLVVMTTYCYRFGDEKEDEEKTKDTEDLKHGLAHVIAAAAEKTATIHTLVSGNDPMSSSSSSSSASWTDWRSATVHEWPNLTSSSGDVTYCEQRVENINIDSPPNKTDVDKADESLYYGLFPQRQVFQPDLPYPLWNYDWDGRLDHHHYHTSSTRQVRKHGVTRHIILIRHGQYDETHRHDERRVLTPLGVQQAHYTGQRIAQLIQSIEQEQQQETEEVSSAAPTIVLIPSQEPGKAVAIRVSNLTRAKQTAQIIAQYLPITVTLHDPDEDLNEGRPCHTIPCTDRPIHTPTTVATKPLLQQQTTEDGYDDNKYNNTLDHQYTSIQQGPVVHSSVIRQVDADHARIERAFHKYFYRAPYYHYRSQQEQDISTQDSNSTMDATATTTTTTITPVLSSQESSILENKNIMNHDTTNPSSSHTPKMIKHEYEIIVCHANVIRYFVCRALQIPPEAWLRFCIFNCSLTYLTIRPTGSVSCRMLGDIGHLNYDMTTFSMHHGFNW